MPRRASPRRRALPLAALLLLLAAGAIALPFAVTPSAAPLLRQNPRTTALLEQRRAEARARGRPYRPALTWVPLDRIAPRLAEAVVLSEDAAFWTHSGIDWHETRAAAEQALERGRLGRGASTITQQLAKNLWLGTERSLWRKAREAALAVKLERALPKRRILALYLNVVEWADGVFGAEAAARHWFGVPARDLSTAQAVVLASMLPAPRRADLARPPRWLARRSRRLLDRLLAVHRIDPAEHAAAAAELDRMLAGPGAAAGGDEEPPEEEEPGPAPEGDPGSAAPVPAGPEGPATVPEP